MAHTGSQALTAMNVQGTAALKPGQRIVLELAPAVGQETYDTPPPPATLLQQIETGDLLVHPSKRDMSFRRLQVQICNVQRRLHLITGEKGQWSDSATQMLHAWLLKPEQKRNRSEASSPNMPLEDLPRLALTDGGSSPPPVKSDVEELDTIEAEHGANDKGTSSGEEHGANDKGASSGEEHGTNDKGTSSGEDSSSSSSTSSSVRKMKLKVKQAKEDLKLCIQPVHACCHECGAAVEHVLGLLEEAVPSSK